MTKHLVIVGLGSIGQRHARNLITLGHDVSALIRPGSTVPAAMGLKYVFRNFEEIRGKKVDGLLICTPTFKHLEFAEKAVTHRIPVLIEKPVSHNYAGVRELRESIKSGGVPAMIGFNFRYHPHVQKIKQIVQKGTLGKLLFAHLWWNDDVRTWYPNEAYARNYTSQAELGGGALLTICHEIDLALWLFGDVRSVYGKLLKLSNLKTTGVEDYFCGILCFLNGVYCRAQMDFITKIPSRGMVITGETGSVQWDYFSGSLKVKVDGERLYESSLGPITPDVKNKMYIKEVEDFIDLIDRKIENPIPYRDGDKVQYIIEKLKRSSLEDRTVYL